MKRHIVILGAGISGLATGWFLKKRYGEEVELTLVDQAAHPGGWVQTRSVGGMLFERGPRGCRSKGKGEETLRLADELGLRDEILCAPQEVHRRYLYRHQTLRPLPHSLGSFLQTPWLWRLPFHLVKEWLTPKGRGEDESVAQFGYRRLGRFVTEELLEPMVLGIYGGEMESLSFPSCFPQLFQWEQEQGSLMKGGWKGSSSSSLPPWIQEVQKRGLFSFRRGMGQLIEALVEQLPGTLLLDEEVVGLGWEEKQALVQLPGRVLRCDGVISALPAAVLAQLVAGWDGLLASHLRGIERESLTLCSLGWKASLPLPQGFGYLIPSKEKADLLGMVWDSQVFPQQNQHPQESRITAMIRGAVPEQEALHRTLSAMEGHLGIGASPQVQEVFHASAAIPQYGVGHGARVEWIQQRLKEKYPWLHLTGNSYHGVGVNDCVSHAKVLASSFV